MTQGRWSIALEVDPTPSVRSAILASLAAHNEQAAGRADWSLPAVTVRAGAGVVVGGLWGRTGYSFLFVERLALGPARGVRLGREVMSVAQAEARRRGLTGMWLDTWTFQAPGFYENLGFSECGRIPDYPTGHEKAFYVKRFAPAEPD